MNNVLALRPLVPISVSPVNGLSNPYGVLEAHPKIYTEIIRKNRIV